MRYNWEEINKLVDDIKEYSDHEYNTESEAIEAMCSVIRRPDYLSEELLSAVMKELNDKLKYYKENSRIVEREETFTRTVTDLEWL